MTEPLAVELAGVVKRFPGVVANDGVDLRVRRGEVHAIVGENGAGKSTLMKILYGMQPPDEGAIRVDGAEVRFRSPKDAIALGIGMVHQHFMLADNLTVLENVVLGAEPRKGPLLDAGAARDRIRELSAAYGMDADPDALVETLAVGPRQRVEILKVLYRGARILILDELGLPVALHPGHADDLTTAHRQRDVVDQRPPLLGAHGQALDLELDDVGDLSLIHISEPTRPY